MHSSMHIYIYEALFLYISKVYTIVFAPLPPPNVKKLIVLVSRESNTCITWSRCLSVYQLVQCRVSSCAIGPAIEWQAGANCSAPFNSYK